MALDIENKNPDRNYITQSHSTNGSNLILSVGQVVNYNRITNTYKIKTNNFNVVSCIWCANLFSGLLGLKCNLILEIGTNVLSLFDQTNGQGYILGSLPNGITDENLNSSNTVGESKLSYLENADEEIKLAAKSDANSAFSIPIDLVDGELNLSKTTGSALNLLHNLAALKAGGSRIECVAMDDMVRIFSDTFKNITAFGDFEIFKNKGGLNVSWKGTSQEYESFGKDNKDTPTGINASSNNIDLGNMPATEAYYESGKSRFSNYIGEIGNFLHLFICDPTKLLNKEADTPASGHFGLNIGEDGSFLLQSVSDIVFEKVCRIAVPVEKIRWEEEVAEATNNDPLKNWTGSKEFNPWEMCYKLRDYAKWFANYYTKAEFIRHNSRFVYSAISEAQVPPPDPSDENQTRRSVNGAFNSPFYNYYLPAYSTIRIFKDGSIMMYDAYDSCINMSGGCVNVSAKKDINISAAGNINLTSKNNTTTAYNTLELAGSANINMQATGPIQLASSTQIALEADGKLQTDIPIESSSIFNESYDDSYTIKLHAAKKSIRIETQDTNGSIIINTRQYINKAANVLFDATSFFIRNIMTLALTGVECFREFKARSSIGAKMFKASQKFPGTTKKGDSLLPDVFCSVRYDESASAQNNNNESDIKEKLKLTEDDIKNSYEAKPKETFHYALIEYDPPEDNFMYEDMSQQVIRISEDSDYETKPISGRFTKFNNFYPYPFYSKSNFSSFIQYPSYKNTDLYNYPCTTAPSSMGEWREGNEMGVANFSFYTKKD